MRGRGRLLFGVLLTGLLVLATAGGAWGWRAITSPGPGGVIYACYSTKTGDLRLVNKAARCSKNERAIQWNVEGERGPRGLRGPQGPAGQDGAAGAQGPPGVAGARVIRLNWDGRGGTGPSFGLRPDLAPGEYIVDGTAILYYRLVGSCDGTVTASGTTHQEGPTDNLWLMSGVFENVGHSPTDPFAPTYQRMELGGVGIPPDEIPNADAFRSMVVGHCAHADGTGDVLDGTVIRTEMILTVVRRG